MKTLGFPCQPFSINGLQLGVEDERTDPLKLILDYIKYGQPSVFVLENVEALVRDFTAFFNELVMFLRQVNNNMYEVHWKVLDACLYSGLPQRRSRVFIIGFKRSRMTRPFAWPEMITPVRLGDLLDPHTGGLGEFARQCQTHQRNILTAMSLQAAAPDTDDAPQIADVGGSKVAITVPDLAPCLTATRTAGMGYWLLNRSRPLSIPELMRLQGLNPARVAGWEAVISQRAMGHIIGNAINIRLFARLMRAILVTIGRPVLPGALP